jgi:uncharacterized protein
MSENTKKIALGLLFSLLVLAALVIGPSFAQDSAPANSTPRTITVSGGGQAFGEPDVAYIELGVSLSSKDLAATFTEANTKLDAVRQALIGLGIAEADLQTTGINIYSNSVYDPQTGAPTEEVMYSVNNTLRITLRDISQVGTVVTTAVDNGANTVYNLSFGITDPKPLEQTAREQAVSNARARAEQLASLLGVTVGEPLQINETYIDNGIGQPLPMNAAMDMGMGGMAAPVQPGRMQVGVSVEITFAIGG